MHVFVATLVATNPDSLESTENLGKTEVVCMMQMHTINGTFDF